jgi:FtsZ-binding cell division protein ZapB
MASEIIIALVGLFCTTVSSVVTFFFTKKKYNSEVEAQYITNIKEAFDTYKNTMQETVSSQNQKIEQLQKENDDLKRQFNQLQQQMVNILMGKKLEDIKSE